MQKFSEWVSAWIEKSKEALNYNSNACDCNNVYPVLGYENSIRGEQCQTCGQLFNNRGEKVDKL